VKKGTSKIRSRSQKPAKRVSAVNRKKTASVARNYLIRSWWIFRGAVAGALILGVFYGAYLGFGKVTELESLSIRIIEVDGCQDVIPENIKRIAGVVKGDPLLRVDLKEVRQKVVSHPWVKDATVVRELPDTLRISVKERVPRAVVLGREFALVDIEGVVLSLQASYPEGYPVITGVSEPLEPGRMVMEARPAVEVLQNISRSGLIGPEKISELGVDGKLVRVSLMDGGTVLVLEQGNTETQVKKLARLMEAGVFDARSAGYDLRYKGRVIGMPGRNHETSGENGLSPAGG